MYYRKHEIDAYILSLTEQPAPLPSDQICERCNKPRHDHKNDLCFGNDLCPGTETFNIALPSEQPSVKETKYSIRVNSAFVMRINDRLGIDDWSFPSKAHICEEIIAEYQAGLPSDQKETTDGK